MQILFIALFFPIFIPPLCVCVCESFFYLWMFSFNSGKKNSNIINPDLQKRPWCANNFFGPYKIFFWLACTSFFEKTNKADYNPDEFSKSAKKILKINKQFLAKCNNYWIRYENWDFLAMFRPCFGIYFINSLYISKWFFWSRINLPPHFFTNKYT